MDIHTYLQMLMKAALTPRSLGLDAAIVPFDPSRRKTRMERAAKRDQQIKRRRAQERRENNEKIVREMNLRKEPKK